MKKIGIALCTLLAVATSACAESPTATAAGAEASLNGVFVGSGHYEEEVMTTTEAERNPGLGLTGH